MRIEASSGCKPENYPEPGRALVLLDPGRSQLVKLPETHETWQQRWRCRRVQVSVLPRGNKRARSGAERNLRHQRCPKPACCAQCDALTEVDSWKVRSHAFQHVGNVRRRQCTGASSLQWGTENELAPVARQGRSVACKPFLNNRYQKPPSSGAGILGQHLKSVILGRTVWDLRNTTWYRRRTANLLLRGCRGAASRKGNATRQLQHGRLHREPERVRVQQGSVQNQTNRDIPTRTSRL
jgi:hypothetical protein